jgi:hypothetical protein
MGGSCCGAQSQVPYYIKDLHPECQALTVRTESGGDVPPNLQEFDQKLDIMPYMACHIESVIVYMGRYITGIEIHFLLDGKVSLFKYVGTGTSHKKKMMVFHADEHITSMSCAYDATAISEIGLKTSSGRFDIFEGEVQCQKRAELSLRDDNKAVIAFKGKYGEYLHDLSIYVCKLIKYPDEREKDDPDD